MTMKRTEPDLVVLSHLRWVWVWQRPQHLVLRMARLRAAEGARTWFVEEPHVEDVAEPELRTEQHGDVTRVWLVVPRVDDGSGNPDLPEYQSPVAANYGDLLAELLAAEGRPPQPDVWVYTPMALDIAQRLEHGRLVYDIMDDLSSFLDAPVGLALRQRRLMAEADVVFTGGRSLHRAAAAQRHHRVYCFPSGVQTAHYASARPLRHAKPALPRVAGYVGVIDERLDLELIGGLAAALPDWRIEMVGPVAKIDPGGLPQADNLVYLGMKAYDELPEVMAGFDVALMPFALNEATRSISPTKTLEYLAAGLPVVSTRVPDVVTDFSQVVHLTDDAQGFADACRHVMNADLQHRESGSRRILGRHEWDAIAARMVELLDEASGRSVGATRSRMPGTAQGESA
ncbi:MAG TPA: glycosyltransferase [Propionibacteriaceae bacterium]|nr:glycosyltransferase [Propionibacteriaceae bacterium]